MFEMQVRLSDSEVGTVFLPVKVGDTIKVYMTNEDGLEYTKTGKVIEVLVED